MIGSWQIRLAVFSCAEVYCIRFQCIGAFFQVARKGTGYLKTENRVRAGRTHPAHAGCACCLTFGCYNAPTNKKE